MAQPAREKKKVKKNKKRKRARVHMTAKTADKLSLYEQSVQNPVEDVKFLHRVFKKEYDRPAVSLREDFCGTAFLCAEWVKSRKDCTALGIDLHRPTLDWGIEKHLVPLGEDARRVTLLEKNVLEVARPKVDINVAFNFSYCIFKKRSELLEYFKVARKSLHEEGLFAIDLHGGPESFEEVEEATEHEGWDYVWDQGPVDAVTHEAMRWIHFDFPDGSRMKRAFTYDWRVWTMPELRELMLDAGFSRADAYWEGADEDGEGNGIFRKVEKAENEESWIAYVVGVA